MGLELRTLGSQATTPTTKPTPGLFVMLQSHHLDNEMAAPQIDLLDSVEYMDLNIVGISHDEAETHGQFLSHGRQGVAPLIFATFQKNKGVLEV